MPNTPTYELKVLIYQRLKTITKKTSIHTSISGASLKKKKNRTIKQNNVLLYGKIFLFNYPKSAWA